MGRKYTYKGIYSDHHVWTSIEPNDAPGIYFRHVNDEPLRVGILQKFKDLGFTEDEISIIMGQEFKHPLRDFMGRNFNVDYPF